MKKRIFLIVLDSVGIGAASDAAEFGDIGADTMRRIHSSEKFSVPTLLSLGLGNIDGIDYLPKTDTPRAALARLREESRGKDTTIGHWEMAGVISTSPLPTYPNGFPRDVIAAFSAATGRGVLCNKPYSGTDVIRDYGETHMETGDLIVYTSADSVFQIAAHEAIVPPETLYEYCRIARGILTGKNAVGRVIARPFIGTAGNFKRTGNRRDFSLEPTGRTMRDSTSSRSGKSRIFSPVGGSPTRSSLTGTPKAWRRPPHFSRGIFTVLLLSIWWTLICFTDTGRMSTDTPRHSPPSIHGSRIFCRNSSPTISFSSPPITAVTRETRVQITRESTSRSSSVARACTPSTWGRGAPSPTLRQR